MLAPNPKKRLTIQDVLAHPWMSDREKVHRTHLPETVESLKVFNSKRKLKAAVQSIAGGITADSMFGTDTDIIFYYEKETA
uniref:Protein kinase domain-containing protein n=1 Tax=Megaselia scalaris TaxID=36166 RepID=T1GXW7_MEGSC